MAGLAALVEWMQPFAGRSCELADWIYGASSAGVICLACRGRSAGKETGFAALGLVVLLALPVLWQNFLRKMPEEASFPVLADFASGWGNAGWDLNGVSLAREGYLQCKASADPEQFPGLFRSPVACDWSAFSFLAFRILWPGKDSVALGVRIDDLPGNPPYGDRYQQHFTLTNGWNEIRMADIGTGKTPDGRLLDWQHVREWGVFLVSPPHFDYFRISNVVLEREPSEESTP